MSGLATIGAVAALFGFGALIAGTADEVVRTGWVERRAGVPMTNAQGAVWIAFVALGFLSALARLAA